MRLSASSFLLSGLLLLQGCGQSSGLSVGEERLAANEDEIATEMIALIKDVTVKRREGNPGGEAQRFNQAKTIACVRGDMEITAASQAQAIGLFAEAKTYPVVMRFANATKHDDRAADLRGLSIRVLGVDGATGAGGTPGVQDFTLNSHPVLFAGTPEDFLAFVKATAAQRLWWFLLTHPRSLWIGIQARGNPDSPLEVGYFSTTPYRYGEGSAVKYAVRSCEESGGRIVADNEDYLRDALQQDLSLRPQCLNFQVQFQTDGELMPVEDASVSWPEDISPFVSVAQITLPVQTITGEEDLQACNEMTFNPWNALPEHQPLGGVNRVRQRVYREIGEFRLQQNRQ